MRTIDQFSKEICNHKQLESFASPASEPAMSNQAAQTLLDVMRGVIDSGTAVGLRPRFQLAGDLAGKTGTTQDNTDGWFILMHPNLVAGAWTGFNDNRVAMRSSYWGQGAHTALFVVGDFMQRAQKANLVDPKAQFAAPRLKDQEDSLLQGARDWWNSVFNSPPANMDNAEVAAMPPVKLEAPVLIPAPTPAAPSADVVPLESTRPNPNVSANAPVLVDPQRVPAFPRPLETARPTETVPGTQVYQVPQPSTQPRAAPATPPANSGGTSAMGAPSWSPSAPVTILAPTAPSRESSPSASFEKATGNAGSNAPGESAPAATEASGSATGSTQ